MCCCEKPTINGEKGYRWTPEESPQILRPNPPDREIGDELIYDEPGRCGGVDSHCHHYLVVKRHGTLYLLVRNGGGDKRIRLSNGKVLLYGLELLGTARYWTLNAIYHAHGDAVNETREQVSAKWQLAAAEKRIKTRKMRGSGQVKVWIEAKASGKHSPYVLASSEENL